MEKNCIYDNGCLLLGTKKDIVEFTENTILKSDIEEEKEYFKDLIKDLNNCDIQDNDIVMINYDSSMGYSLDWWSNEHRIEVK